MTLSKLSLPIPETWSSCAFIFISSDVQPRETAHVASAFVAEKISGIDKAKVGEKAAKIRRIRPPEPYKGKGIRYIDEEIRLKAGKAGKTGAEAGA